MVGWESNAKNAGVPTPQPLIKRCMKSLRSISKAAKMPRRVDSPEVKLSKSMSYILRHGAAKEGVAVSPEGYVAVDDMLTHPRFKGSQTTFEDIQRIVENNNKKRFALKQEDGKWFVRATQGHSFDVDLGMKPLAKLEDFPSVVVHGTYMAPWEKIKTEGLCKMTRNHIHLASGKFGEEGVISGMRASANVFIYIDIAKALAQGIKFEQSENGVILTAGDENGRISPGLFLKVEDKSGNDLLN